jgi:endonuclease IV
LIVEKAMKSFLNHPKLKHLPFVMETPALKDPDTAKSEVEKLQSWAK